MKYGFGMVTHTYGVGSDTTAPGPQAEAALRAQLVSLSGADILGGVGRYDEIPFFLRMPNYQC